MPASVYVLEGSWDRPAEAPQILPYLQAYENSHREVRVFHRTIRTIEDIQYYVSSIPRNARAFVYFACHGEVGWLNPSDKKNRLSPRDVRLALGKAKEHAVSFLHFGCCEFVRPATGGRKQFLKDLASDVHGNIWVSGYTREVEWLSSTLFDLALISEVYVPWRKAPTHLKSTGTNANRFIASYVQLAKSLGFSALAQLGTNAILVPPRL